ncbi:phosphotransferase family protein [Nocardia sp. NPDC101769]|uniref:phosphotransferase family protein n=1 Tax=Nocardia sp. NPDC101769 TaxID=3364333 RepID=UPI00382B97CC
MRTGSATASGQSWRRRGDDSPYYPPRKKRKVRPWVLGGFSAVVLLFFGGCAIPIRFPEAQVPPVATIETGWRTLESRPFRLVHADVHRKNMIIRDGQEVVFLDWELALYGDPVYDVAPHLHKMGYQPDEYATFLRLWATAEPEE